MTREQLAALGPEPDETAVPRIQDGETGAILARVWNREITPGKAYELLAEQPWTPRERRLLKFLEKVDPILKRIDSDGHDYIPPAGFYEVADEIAAALADTPQPDPRDEALEAAEKALTEFLEVGKLDMSNPKYVGYWCGLSDALAAIARAKGGTR